MRHTSKFQGFTLVELLVTVIVLGVVLTVGVPSFRDFLLRSQLETAVEKVYGDLRYTRSEAIKRNTAISMSFTDGSAWCYGMNDGAGCDCGTADDCQMGGITTVVSSSDYSSVSLTNSFTGNSTQFDNARGTAGSGAVTLTLSGMTAVISLNAVGQVEICSDDLLMYSGC